MLVCTKRWKEPSEEKYRYLVYDTDDESEEECSVDEIKSAFSSGYKIYGLMMKNGKVAVNSKLMSYTTDYRYYNGENLHIGVYQIKVVATQAIIFTDVVDSAPTYVFEIADEVNDRFKRYAVYDGSNVYVTRAVPRVKDKLFYVQFEGIIKSEFEGKPLYSISYTYYDKHYYREDEGKEFYKYELIWGSQTVSLTEWSGDYNNKINVTETGKFKWCNQDVDLNMWR